MKCICTDYLRFFQSLINFTFFDYHLMKSNISFNLVNVKHDSLFDINVSKSNSIFFTLNNKTSYTTK